MAPPRGPARMAAIFVMISSLCISANAAKTIAAELVASGFKQPTYVCSDPNDSSRLFVLERGSGKIKLVKSGVVQSKPFLSLGDKVSSNHDGEQGLFGMVFPPDYGTKDPFFYVCYSNIFGASVVEAYKVGSNADRAKNRAAKSCLKPG